MSALPNSLRSPLLLTAVALPALAIMVFGAQAQTPSSAVAGDAEAGEELFESVCSECHGAAATAPTLRGVIGRPIASVASFSSAYSAGLKAKSGQSWTLENLNAFLKSPSDFAPGTEMKKQVPDAKNRADLLAYIATLPPPRN
jgi:cytochrome c